MGFDYKATPTNSNDEYYTSQYFVNHLFEYKLLPDLGEKNKDILVWCPFDKSNSSFVVWLKFLLLQFCNCI